MRRNYLYLVFSCLLFSQVAFAQYEGAHALNYKFIGIDAYTPYFYSDADDVKLRDNIGNAIDDMTAGAEISYYYGIKDWLAVGVPFRVGTSNVGRDSVNLGVAGRDKIYMSLDARLRLSLFLKEKQIVVPYVGTGLGAMKLEGEDIDLQIPLATGLNFRLAKNFYAQIQTEYRWSFDEIKDKDVDSYTNHFVHSAGFMFQFGDREDTVPPDPEPETVIVEEPKDKDGDGVIDEKDNCPDEAGLAKFSGCPDKDGDDIQDSEDDCPDVAGPVAFNGCPDTDNDGIADKDDKCPNEAGILANNGCPEEKPKDRDNDGVADDADECPDTPGIAGFNGCPDTDGDGVADKKDRCPSTPGIAAFGGCPDTDKDGVEDAKDKCPKTAGSVANNGCPEIAQEDQEKLEIATQSVEFETAKSTIRTTSYPVLDQVVAILQKYPTHSISIDGHTDNVGSEANNQKLSESRAKACYEYLASKGISRSRMSYAGYGESRPIADNGSKEGRQKNRRVEFRVFVR